MMKNESDMRKKAYSVFAVAWFMKRAVLIFKIPMILYILISFAEVFVYGYYIVTAWKAQQKKLLGESILFLAADIICFVLDYEKISYYFIE